MSPATPTRTLRSDEGAYGTYRAALSNKSGADAFEAPLAEEGGTGNGPPTSEVLKAAEEGVAGLDTQVEKPKSISKVGDYSSTLQDYVFEDLNRTYDYTIKPSGDIYFTNRNKGRKGVIPAADNSPRAVKAREAILAMKAKVPPLSAPSSKEAYSGRWQATPDDVSMAEYDAKDARKPR